MTYSDEVSRDVYKKDVTIETVGSSTCCLSEKKASTFYRLDIVTIDSNIEKIVASTDFRQIKKVYNPFEIMDGMDERMFSEKVNPTSLHPPPPPHTHTHTYTHTHIHTYIPPPLRFLGLNVDFLKRRRNQKGF